MGGLCDYKHKIMIQHKDAAGTRWLLPLRHFPGSSLLVWPFHEKLAPGYENKSYFTPVIGLQMPELVTVYDFSHWTCRRFIYASPACQYLEAPDSRTKWPMFAVRLFKVTCGNQARFVLLPNLVGPLCGVVVECAFGPHISGYCFIGGGFAAPFVLGGLGLRFWPQV